MSEKIPECNYKYSHYLRKIKANIHFVNPYPDNAIIDKKGNYRNSHKPIKFIHNIRVITFKGVNSIKIKI
tara:strand:+ start:555 stop:764 length:210 start_codon:yes stop_codon:yes gene_type:complete